jgi:uroporphyrinogen-III synthase
MEKLTHHGVLLTNTRQPTAREITFWKNNGYTTVDHQALLKVQFKRVTPLEIIPQGIILTSANSALALEHSNWDRAIPVYGVGIATSKAAKAAGFLDCSSPSDKPYPSAINLMNWIKKNLNPEAGPFVFGCGTIVRHNIDEALKRFGFTIQKVILYSTEPTLTFNKKIELALKNHQINTVAISSEQALVTFITLCKKADIPFNDFNLLVPSQFLKTVATRLGYLKSEISPPSPYL